MAQSLHAVREAAIDGRMHNIFIRRTQLERLQQTLINEANVIQDAIRQDTGFTASEATVEYLLTLRTLKEYHQSLDPARALRDEYAIARGEDAPDQREPVGIIYIVPSKHTFFYSTVTAVAGALAAGDCVVIEVPTPIIPVNVDERQIKSLMSYI
jgi:acyl-CoA reductase-like NAD-dependent aldehyde dehydrogenase